MRVLIAEDNPLWRKNLAMQVKSWGFEAVIADNGRQALEILEEENSPSLAILDWQMPELDGIDVCKKIKRDPDNSFTYVIILSSRDADEDMVAGLDAGADDYLTKPVESKVLRSRLMAAKRIVELVPPKEWAIPRIPDYELHRVIGKGAFATVWEATHQPTDRTVALKIIRVDLATEDVFNRFGREIQLTRKLAEHPNIASVFDSHVDKKLAFYAMEFVDGLTLSSFVKKEKPAPELVLKLVADVCDGLEHAHEHGIVHRDLTPTNIMVNNEQSVKIVDFGLARSMFNVDLDAEANCSLDGAVIGSPMFMSPEQARGENDTLDARSDIYAAGIVLYVLLLRRHPLDIDQSDRRKTIRAIALGKVRKPRDLNSAFSRNLQSIMLKALSANPEDRYQTAGDFGAAIRGYLAQRAEKAKKRRASGNSA